MLVHPDCQEVIARAPESILKQDGAKKNDCERNAVKRLLIDLRWEHPHLKLIVIEDALACNARHVRLLKELDLRFILVAKRADHTFSDAHGVRHRFRYLNGAPSATPTSICRLASWSIGKAPPATR